MKNRLEDLTSSVRILQKENANLKTELTRATQPASSKQNTKRKVSENEKSSQKTKKYEKKGQLTNFEQDILSLVDLRIETGLNEFKSDFSLEMKYYIFHN